MQRGRRKEILRVTLECCWVGPVSPQDSVSERAKLPAEDADKLPRKKKKYRGSWAVMCVPRSDNPAAVRALQLEEAGPARRSG